MSFNLIAMNLMIPIRLSLASDSPVTVSIATKGGSATPPNDDYHGAYEFIEFAHGETEKEFSVAILQTEEIVLRSS